MYMPKSERSSFSVATAGAVIHGTLQGHGPPVILLHGGPGCYDYFAGSAAVEWLAGSHLVCSYDQRGCRGSASSGPFTIQANVADLEAVRQYLEAERIGVLGHSAGAMLGASYIARHPDRVEWFVALSPAGQGSKFRAVFDRTIRQRATPDQRQSLEEIDALIRRTDDPREREELYRRHFEKALPCYVDPGHRDRAPRMEYFSREVSVQVMASFLALCRDPAWRASLQRFPGRSGIIHGRTDPIPWMVVDEWAALLPRAEVYPLDRCGHFPWLEEPDACRAALFAFLHADG